MKNDGKIGLYGLGTSGDSRSGGMYTTRATGFYGNGMKGMSRPKSPRSAYLGMRHSRAVVLLVVFAAAIVIVSGIALAPIGKEKASEPAKTLVPGAPHTILGISYDAVGAPLPGTTVTITDLRTGLSTVVITDAVYAGYLIDLGSFTDWLPSDEIKITGEKGVMTGENQSLVGGGGKTWLNVTLDVVIPEFPMVIVPVMGMLVLFAVVSLRRRNEDP